MAIPLTPPTITITTGVNFVFNAHNVDFPSPVIDDNLTNESTRISRQTRGLRRRIYKSPDWFDRKIYNYTFRNITDQQKADFLAFHTDVRSHGFQFTDYVSTVRTTMYMENVSPFVEQRAGGCSWTITLRLQEIL